MKVICIGRNYAQHASELGNDVPAEPVVFLKPGSALTVGGKPFFYPEFSRDVHYELELVYRVCRNGKAIERRFASRYYDAVGLGIDFTARDVQADLKSRGLPWEKAKAFDGSAALGELVALDELPPGRPLEFCLERNGETVQRGSSDEMLFDVDAIVAEVSRYFTLQLGDLIFTGTPAGVGPVRIGDRLVGYLGDRRLLDVRVK